MVSREILKYYSLSVIIANVSSMLLLIISYFVSSIIGNASIVIFFIAFAIDIGLIVLDFLWVNPGDMEGGQLIKNITWTYIFSLLTAIILLGLSPFTYSFIQPGALVYSVIPYSMISGIGIILAFIVFNNAGRAEAWK